MTRSAVIGSLAAAALLAAALTSTSPDHDATTGNRTDTRSRARARDTTPTPAPPRVPSRTLNRQDRTERRQRHAESAAHDGRPLLTQLPLTRNDVTIDIAGLTPDGHLTLLSIRHPHATRRHARAVYRRALRTAHDNGRAYRTRYRP